MYCEDLNVTVFDEKNIQGIITKYWYQKHLNLGAAFAGIDWIFSYACLCFRIFKEKFNNDAVIWEVIQKYYQRNIFSTTECEYIAQII